MAFASCLNFVLFEFVLLELVARVRLLGVLIFACLSRLAFFLLFTMGRANVGAPPHGKGKERAT